jgi:hypothetical protein
MTQRKPQGLTKRQLIPPGEFFAIPYNVARDPRLTPVDKLVFGGLADHLRGRSMSVWPSVARLAELTGQGERTVRRSIGNLADVGYITTEQRIGLTQLVTFQAVDSGGEQDLGQNGQGNQDPGQIGTPAESADTPAKKAKTPAKLAPETSRLNTLETPPEGGDCFRSTQNLKATTKAIGQAYRQATGSDMPSAWRRHIKNEWNGGDREALASIDAEVLTAAFTDGLGGLGFHLTNVVAYLHKRKAAAAVIQANKSRAAAAAQGEADDRRALDAANAARLAQAADRLAALRALPAADRKAWTTAAMKKHPMFRNAARIESMAAYLYDLSLDESQVLEIEAEA